ncbi:hypothetical protein OEZ86_007123 [Tetradesmus obliquus]|nr:hypothetical protein OEZ86_007123 [Tetradesmus obliquus]
MDAVKEGITIADCSKPDMPLMYVNMGFCRITGYSLAEVLYKNCRFLQGSCSDQESRVQLRAAINAGRACVAQLMNFRKNGDPFVNLLSITPIHDANGTLTHYVGIQSDITELVNHRKAELAARHAALQAAAATEAKSQFLARMSHEIRTPLNGMIAVGQLLAETSLSPAQWDLVNTIRCSGETLLTLITDILDFSRIEANKLVLTAAVFSLQTVVEAAMEIAGLRAAQKRLQMAYHISSGIPRLLCGDAQRLQQVLLNVLNNAVKFTESGEILLEIWAEPPVTPGSASPVTPSASLVTQSSAQDSGSGVTSDARGSIGSGVAPGGPEEWPTRLIRFSVKDTGIGISAPDLGKLFKSFSQVDASVTRSYGGSGLGLVISKRLAEAMGGRMWAESAGPGHGSTFSWSIAVKFPQGGRNSTVNTAAKSRRSSVLLSAAKQQRQQQQHNSGSDGSGLRGDLNLAGVLGLAPGFSNPGGGGFCQDSDETCSVVSSDAGTFGSERETISLLGPYDCVLLDMHHTRLLSALTLCEDREAARLVFMGWPGQGEVEAAAPQFDMEFELPVTPPVAAAAAGTQQQQQQQQGGLALQLQRSPSGANVAAAAAAAAAAVPAVLQLEEHWRPGSRQLGYVTVTRPLRQGRLKLALEEVLVMSLDPVAPDSPHGSSSSIGGGSDGYLAVTAAAAAAAAAGLGHQSDLHMDLQQQQQQQGAGEVLAIQQHQQQQLHVEQQPHEHPDSRLAAAAAVKQQGCGLDAVAGGSKTAALRVLLAEDNAINMKVATGILARIGVQQVAQAVNGAEALAAVEARGGGDAFDVLLIDLHMPLMGGMECVSCFKQRYPHSRSVLVAVTADAFEDTRDRCLEAGFDAWLAKPFRVEDLVKVISDSQARLQQSSGSSSSSAAAGAWKQ